MMSSICPACRGASVARQMLKLQNFLSTVNAARSWSCRIRRQYSSASQAAQTTASESPHVEVGGRKYSTDSWYNVPPNILAATSRKLHIQKDHPVSITRQIIEQNFPAQTFKPYNTFHPVVSTHENFDSLGFPPDHPGRARSDTYYINQQTLLRTHTSAHEAYLFQNRETDGYLIAADVYRRDEVDRTHYPVFHQMEGARVWDRDIVPDGDVAAAVYRDLERLREHDMKVEDPNPPFHVDRNPLQAEHHSPAEAEAIGTHLKRSLELLVVDVFTRAKKAAMAADPDFVDEPLQVRWIEAYFPFTSPSWELEVYYGGDWLELLGCGVTKQELYINARRPSQLGWAFGIGLDRLAMLLFQIPDIRLFWSQDKRFLNQFAGISDNLDLMKRFAPYSKYPASPKDVSFWLRSTSAAGGNVKANTADFHENDLMEIVRSIAGDTVEDVSLIDEFKHPNTGRASMCYRINYRSLERTLTHAETSRMHGEIKQALVDKLGVEIR